MIGNEEGIILLQMLNDMKHRVESLGGERFLNRINELVKESPQSSKHDDKREERNARIHGADIKVDLKALDWIRRHDRYSDMLSAAREGFEAIYGVSSSEWKSLVHKAPQEVIGSANKLGDLTLRCRYHSRQRKEIADQMKKTCKDAIHLWKQSLPDAQYPKSAIALKKSDYDKLHRE
ncbi:hypothetical protein UA08_02261 [Talaromyces atroroseus]|uniref:Uncharacterized protein n=1 Tax=Talaromyces atroroseus TaxID=1441469 RepID=A0A225ALB6_TALAT|nr:hypothetical protein UA08_02261 [Talaromyces atroroseus]OKL62371.1 hypothetical protein UA08_02261 [Talaromyces atroroseus]